jgi:uncharacterized protein YegJ (DUF2314 family)
MKLLVIGLLSLLAISPGIWGAEEETTQTTTQAEQSAGREATAPGQTNYAQVGDNDKQMDRAVENAQRTLGFFMAAVRAKKPGDEEFEIKKAFVDGDKVEHVWIRGVTFDGKNFHGKVDNRPVDVKNVQEGQRVTVAPQDVDDWMFLKDGKLIGAYTTRVLYARLTPAQKAEFDKNSGYKIQ